MQFLFVVMAIALVITSIRVSGYFEERKSTKRLERALLIRRTNGIHLR